MSRLVAAVGLAAVLMLACGSDDGDDAPSAAGRDATATTSATTTTLHRTPASTAPGACPAAPVPAEATEVSVAAGDFDGDGRPDEVRTYRHIGDYYVQIGLAAGGGDTLRVRPDLQAGLAPIGGFDVDGDGDDEAWVRVSAGGPVRVVGLLAFDACTLAEISVDGAPARFAINRTFLGGSGVECAAAGGAGITVFEGSSDDGANFSVQRRTLRLDGAALVQVAQDTSTVDAGTAQFSFNCGSLSF